MKKKSLQERLCSYLRNRPNERIAKGFLCDLARQKVGSTGENTGRRLRILVEASNYGSNPQSPSYNEQLRALQLLDGAKVQKHTKGNSTYYWYEPAEHTVEGYEIVDGVATLTTKITTY